MGRPKGFVARGAAAPQWLAVGLFAAQVLSCAIVVAAELPDTNYCWPTVVVRSASTGEPLRATVRLYRVLPDSNGEGGVASSVGVGSTWEHGAVEFPGALSGPHLVYVAGIAERRPLPDWKPPPESYPREVAVGFDPWRRPEQFREFSEWRLWTIVYGNCLDTLVIRPNPGKWETPDGCRHITLSPPPPKGYRLERGGVRR